MLLNQTLLTLIFAMAFSLPVALAVGVTAVRYRGYSYAMLTLMIGMVVYSVLWKWVDVTGGDMGIRGFPRGFIGPFDLQPLNNYFYFLLAIFEVCIFIFYRIDKSFFGLTLKALKDNIQRVNGIGLNSSTAFIVAFLLSATFSALSGALNALLLRAVHPSLSDWTRSFEPICACVLGGAAFFEGPVIGALLYSLVKDLLMRRTEFWLMYMGIILVVVVLTLREGVAFYLRRLLRRGE
jgi:branched-chain amino acid transport system permease protein